MKAPIPAAAAAAAALGAVLLTGSSAQALRLPAARHCPVFPTNNPWNERVDKLPVSADSAQLISSIGLDAPVHADFGSGLIGIPFDVVSRKTPLRHVSFQYADESDRVRYPIPSRVHIEGGVHATGYRHAILVDRSSCRLYELYPARHYASSSNDPSLPPMGLRVRLKASVNIASFPRQARVVLRALQRYGMILADNGSPWYVSGAPNRHWSNDALHALGRLTGADFEVVDTSSLPRPGK
jgi:hypothetical protein